MIRYEILMLARPDTTSDEIANLEKAIETQIADAKGKVVTFDRWGKYRLSYPVEKNSYGQYVLSRFEVSENHKGKLLRDLDTLIKIKHNEQIVRFVTKLLAPDAPITYAKPEPVDSSESRERDKTLSKIENSLKETPAPVVEKKAAPAPTQAPAEKPSADATQPSRKATAGTEAMADKAEPETEAAATDDDTAEA